MTEGPTHTLLRSVTLACMLGLGISACTTAQLARVEPSIAISGVETPEANCRNLLAQIDHAVFGAAVQDVQSQRIPGFAYLRTNRFLSSFKDEVLTSAKLEQWLETMRDLDRQDRAIELGNLDAASASALQVQFGANVNLMTEITRCGETLAQADLASPERLALLRNSAVSPDSYSTTLRAFGLYPITSLFIKQGVTQLQQEIRTEFADASRWQNPLLQHFEPSQVESLSAQQLQTLISESVANPLAIPQFTVSSLPALFDHYAPIWTIETESEADKPGVPVWLATGESAIDTTHPFVYTHLSVTRLHDQNLPQFNYSIWFPERPRTGLFDILGGHYDGITLRVTVGLDGQPIHFDAMHNCGCYHMAFPVRGRLIAKETRGRKEEPLLVPISLAPASFDSRIELYIAANTHYIEGARMSAASEPTNASYALRSAQFLRALPTPTGGTKSLFGADGLVAGTQRRERWLLWPMGVIEPGAMRQWGHHAVAFYGRRHFDDPDLVERYFEAP